jgi:PHD/YefM family antitoxin component YafN of YafNO toxin-antitoxin module
MKRVIESTSNLPQGTSNAFVTTCEDVRIGLDHLRNDFEGAPSDFDQARNNLEHFFITLHGRPNAHLVDVETYELMQQRMSLLGSIARGEIAIAEGRVLFHVDAKQRMAKWLK